MKNNASLNSVSTLVKALITGIVLVILLVQLIRNQLSAPPTDAPRQPSAAVPVTQSMAEPPAAAAPAEAHQPTLTPARPKAQTSGFDFYVLNLSWSPDYCAANGTNDPQQCSIGKRLAFVLHGLWPQYNKGYPSDCSNEKLPAGLKDQYAGLYPSQNLFDHEWEKHGTCSGLDPQAYLSLSKQLKESIVIPEPYRKPEQPLRVTVDQLKQDFSGANPGLGASSLAVYCSGNGRYLTQLYICFSTAGSPAACSAEVNDKAAKSCRSADFLVRNIK